MATRACLKFLDFVLLSLDYVFVCFYRASTWHGTMIRFLSGCQATDCTSSRYFRHVIVQGLSRHTRRHGRGVFREFPLNCLVVPASKASTTVALFRTAPFTFLTTSNTLKTDTVFSARCNIYISRLCYDVSVRLSVRPSVTFVHCGHRVQWIPDTFACLDRWMSLLLTDNASPG